MTKTELRARMLISLRGFAGRTAASEAICAAIRRHEAWASARSVCAFFPLPSEPQITPLWTDDGAREFCFPRIRDGGVELIRIADPELRRRATWKLDAPELAAVPTVAPDEVDLFLVPGLAFTARGARLGRGGGYYDRLLPRRAAGSTALGICFDLQIVAAVPHESHDQNVDAVLTELALLRDHGQTSHSADL